MFSSPTSKARRGVLLALTATAALAPSSAIALDDNPGTTQCRAPKAGDTVIWNNSQFCAVEQGSGGGWGTGAAGSVPAGRQGPEIIWASSDAPRDPVVECFRNPARCLSHQVGGRGGRQEIDGDGSGSGGSSQGGSRAGGDTGAPGKRQGQTKGMPKPFTQEWCRMLGVGEIRLPTNSSVGGFRRRVDEMQGGYNRLADRLHLDLERKHRSIYDRLKELRQSNADSDRIVRLEGILLGVLEEIDAVQKEMGLLREKWNVLLDLIEIMEEEDAAISAVVHGKCAELFGRDRQKSKP